MSVNQTIHWVLRGDRFVVAIGDPLPVGLTRAPRSARTGYSGGDERAWAHLLDKRGRIKHPEAHGGAAAGGSR